MRDKIIYLVLGILLALLAEQWTDNAAPSGPLQVTRLELVNGQGAVVLALGTDANDNGFVTCYNQTGKPVSRLGIDSNGNGYISCLSRTGAPGVGISTLNGRGSLSCYNAEGQRAVQIEADENDNGHISCNTASGATVAGLGVNTRGDGGIECYNRSGILAAALGVNTRGDGIVGTDLNTDPSIKSSYTIAMTAGAVAAGAPASCNGVAADTTVSTYFIGAAPTSGGGSAVFRH